MYFVGRINLSIVGLKHKVIIVDDCKKKLFCCVGFSERCDPRVFLGISLDVVFSFTSWMLLILVLV